MITRGRIRNVILGAAAAAAGAILIVIAKPPANPTGLARLWVAKPADTAGSCTPNASTVAYNQATSCGTPQLAYAAVTGNGYTVLIPCGDYSAKAATFGNISYSSLKDSFTSNVRFTTEDGTQCATFPNSSTVAGTQTSTLIRGSHIEYHHIKWNNTTCVSNGPAEPPCTGIAIQTNATNTATGGHDVVLDDVSSGYLVCADCAFTTVTNSDFGPSFDSHSLLHAFGSVPVGGYTVVPHDILIQNTNFHDVFNSDACIADSVCFSGNHSGCAMTVNNGYNIVFNRTHWYNCEDLPWFMDSAGSDIHDLTLENSVIGGKVGTPAGNWAPVSVASGCDVAGSCHMHWTNSWSTDNTADGNYNIKIINNTFKVPVDLNPSSAPQACGSKTGVGGCEWRGNLGSINLGCARFGDGWTVERNVDTSTYCGSSGTLLGGATGTTTACSGTAVCQNNYKTDNFGFAANGYSVTAGSNIAGALPCQSWTPTDDFDGATRACPTTFGADDPNAGGSSDTTPPDLVTVTSPTGGTVQGTISLVATAHDNVGVAGVQFKVDGANVGAEDTTSPYSVNWDTTTVTNASHTITAVARDAANNQTASPGISVTVNNPDTTFPVVSITSPLNGNTIAGTTTVQATATDNVGVVGVQFKLDGANLGAEDLTFPYSVSWNTISSTDGSHTLTAVARDAAGNAQPSAGVTVTVNNGGGGGGGGGSSQAICSPSPCTAGPTTTSPPGTFSTSNCPAAGTTTTTAVWLGNISNGSASECRVYGVYIPTNLKHDGAVDGKPAAVVVGSGGGTCGAAEVTQGMLDGNWDVEAVNSRLIIIQLYKPRTSPSCGRSTWYHPNIDVPSSGSNSPSDEPYVAAVLADAKTRFHIDPARISIGGPSNMGGLTWDQMCDDRINSQFRTFFPVSSTLLAPDVGGSPGTVQCGATGSPTNRNFFVDIVIGSNDSSEFTQQIIAGRWAIGFDASRAFVASYLGCSATPTSVSFGTPTAANVLYTYHNCGFGTPADVFATKITNGGHGYNGLVFDSSLAPATNGYTAATGANGIWATISGPAVP